MDMLETNRDPWRWVETSSGDSLRPSETPEDPRRSLETSSGDNLSRLVSKPWSAYEVNRLKAPDLSHTSLEVQKYYPNINYQNV